MIDLVCLVADKNMEAALDGILRRPEALGIKSIEFELLVHPERDPGCFFRPEVLLNGYLERAAHGLVIMDAAWERGPDLKCDALQSRVDRHLQDKGLGDWAKAVVIHPELEAWVFSDSPHVENELGWSNAGQPLRRALEEAGLWDQDSAKPEDPKRAMEWAMRRANRSRSSAVYRLLAQSVGLRRCTDSAFERLRSALQQWFSH